MLTLFAKLLAALNSASSSRQIALAITLGMIIGLTPTLSLHNLLVLLIAFVIRVNLSAFFISMGGFATIALALATPLASLGENLLQQPSLIELWTILYQTTLFKLMHFHHTLTLGAVTVAVLLFIPLLLASQWLIDGYRHTMRTFVEKFRVVQTLKSSRFYQLYLDFSA